MGSMGMGAPYYAMMNSAAVAPFTGVTSSSPAYHYGLPSGDVLPIDDLLDFSNHDIVPSAGGSTTAPVGATTNGNEAGQYFFSPAEPCSFGGSCPGSGDQNSFDLYMPCEEAAELEWLSNFVDDSFSDIPNYQSVGLIAPSGAQSQFGRADQSAVARGARSKRSRSTSGSTSAAAWTSSLLPLPAQSSPSSSSTSSSSSEFPSSKAKANSSMTINNNGSSRGKKGGGADLGIEGGVRRCTHCASEKTPQWRTGPLGPKTLCNACGVRFKSGRLVPEYRPAASPTFVLTQHSNSHRKVMELRRQKELHLLNNNNNAAARPDVLFNDHHHHYGVY